MVEAGGVRGDQPEQPRVEHAAPLERADQLEHLGEQRVASGAAERGLVALVRVVKPRGEGPARAGRALRLVEVVAHAPGLPSDGGEAAKNHRGVAFRRLGPPARPGPRRHEERTPWSREHALHGPSMRLRGRQESNLRPLAPEANALSN
jgi:hypothetical protein